MSNTPPPTPPITEDKFKFNSPCVCENNDYPCLCDDYGPQEGISIIHPDGRYKTEEEIISELEQEEEKKFIATFCWICCKKNPNTPTEADLKKMIWVCDNEDCKKSAKACDIEE
jgi:hypothetical protein